MKHLFFYMFLLINLAACIGEKGSFYAKPGKNQLANDKLMMDGNYVGIIENQNKKKGFSVFCLYNNGVALKYYVPIDSFSIGIVNNMEKTKIEKKIAYSDSTYKVKQAGGFRINGDKIEIQIFEFINYGMFEVCTYKGDIINDSTIHISSCFMKSKSNFCPSNFDLKFTQMPKPDSTNQLMSKSWYWENK